MESVLSTCLSSVTQGWDISNKLSEGANVMPQEANFRWPCWDIGAQVAMERCDPSRMGTLADIPGGADDLLD